MLLVVNVDTGEEGIQILYVIPSRFARLRNDVNDLWSVLLLDRWRTFVRERVRVLVRERVVRFGVELSARRHCCRVVQRRDRSGGSKFRLMLVLLLLLAVGFGLRPTDIHGGMGT